MIAIIGAMEAEVVEVLKLMDNYNEKVILNTTFYQGFLNDKEVVLVLSGVGKVLAAMSTTILINNFNVDAVINIGSAGGLSPNLDVLDVVVSERVAIADFDLSAFGYKQGFNEKRYTFNCDKHLLSLLHSLDVSNVYFGDMVSSDTFISNNDQVNNILKHYPTSLCADMEAGAIAMVLNEVNIPFIVIRSISDSVVKTIDNKLEFEIYLSLASKNSALLAANLISKM